MKPLIVEELIKANAGYDEAELIEELWECYVRFKADNDRSGTVGTDRDRILRIEALLREGAEPMTPVTKIRTGVVAEHRGKFWGVLHEDGHSRSEGWGPIEAATISDPKYCHRPEDMTYPNSHYLPELRKATLRPIRVETTYTVSSENTER